MRLRAEKPLQNADARVAHRLPDDVISRAFGPPLQNADTEHIFRRGLGLGLTASDNLVIYFRF